MKVMNPDFPDWLHKQNNKTGPKIGCTSPYFLVWNFAAVNFTN